jgi:hypothetical protein
MVPILLCAAVLSVEGDPGEAITGKVRLTRAVGGPLVYIVAADVRVRVEGDLKGEVARLQSARVEVLGRREGDLMHVSAYRIVDVGGGVKPTVGLLVETASGLALSDGEGAVIPLSLNPRGRRRLQGKAGAKLWVSGRMLPTGELKVQRYGILRDPPKAAKSGP